MKPYWQVLLLRRALLTRLKLKVLQLAQTERASPTWLWMLEWQQVEVLQQALTVSLRQWAALGYYYSPFYC